MSACAQKKDESVKADPDVKNSFSSTDAKGLPSVGGLSVEKIGKGKYLILAKSALDKEFLLSTSIISQKVAPTSSGLQGHVVAFSRKGERLFLMEAREGHVVSPSLPSNLILTEIPVLLETDDDLVLDFDAGMRIIFTQGNWHVSDISGRAFDADATNAAVSIGSSYLEKIETLDSKYVEIRQTAQVYGAGKVEPYEIRYFISPYEKNDNFKPLESSVSYDHVGFFEAPPFVEKETGRSVVHATIFDASKPIKYYVSANTPKEYQEAVKDGILYWNRVFGKEIIQVEMAPADITAPDPRRNIVQWVEWDQAGFAYADALMDPRTGEIKSAQVYMTSAFAWGSQLRARRMARLLDDSSSVESKSEAFKSGLGLKGMESASLCSSDRSSQIGHVANVALSSGLSDEAMMKLSQDYVREVISHEIGHTLGLRHNFAGSLGSNMPVEEIQKRFMDLLKDPSTPTADVIPSSSVMEYQPIAEAVINGRQMARKEHALPYDVAAIRGAYFGEVQEGDKPLFCTDSHAMTHQDCVRFDRGQNPIEGARFAFQTAIDGLPVSFVETYLSKVGAANDIERGGVSSVEVDPKKLATPIVAEVKTILSYLDSSKKSLILERRYEVLSSLKDKDLVRDRYNWLSQIADKQGSWSELFFSELTSEGEDNLLSPDWSDSKVEEVKAFLAKPLVQNFVGRDGKTRTLSKEDIKTIEDASKVFFKEMQQQLVGQLMDAYKEAKWTLEIAATDSIQEGGLVMSLESALDAFVPVVATQKSQSTVQIPRVDGTMADVQEFFFGASVRKGAAALVAASFVDLVDWAKATREETRDEYRNLLAADLGVTRVKEVEAAIKAGNRQLQIWWKTEKSVFAAFGGAESPAEADPKVETAVKP